MRVFITFITTLFIFASPVMAKEPAYICPMHEHISGEQGDQCSICGMNLVAQEVEVPMSDHDHSTHSVEPEKSKADETEAKESVYMCPMHPHIIGEEGDSCPICGMFLTPKDVEPDPAGDEHSSVNDVQGAIHIDPSYVQALGVRTSEARHHKFGKSIRSFGRIAPSTRLEHSVDVRTKGWVVDLAAAAVGDSVKKGDLLFTFYSPDLMRAQSDYLIGGRVGSSEQRLRLFGMDKQSIAFLKKKSKFLEETPFYAKADGTVTTLNVRKGSHVNEGGTLMRLQDFSKLWINVDVPMRDVQFLEVGTPAKVSVPETGEAYETVVDFIHPVNDPKSRTATVRLIIENPDGVLKPDTYVDAVFDADAEVRLAVATEAVLYGGMGAYVMEDVSDGYFKSIMVETGITANGLTEIKKGLLHGQNIVTSGQFMLDAESNLRGGMASMDHSGMTEQPEVMQEGNAHDH